MPASVSLCAPLHKPQVGTLDSLMSLSDDLVRIDMLVENMVRKIEKQYTEVAGDQDPLKVGDHSIATPCALDIFCLLSLLMSVPLFILVQL